MRGIFDYPPRAYSETQRATWEALYQQAARIYGHDGKGEERAPVVAGKVCNDLWGSSGHERALPRPMPMPHPGGLIWLGHQMDFHYFKVSRTGAPEIASMSALVRGRQCLWSQHLRAVLCYPRLQLRRPTVAAESLPELLALYRKWHGGPHGLGKPPKSGGASEVQLPDPTFRSVHVAVATLYRSDKFDDNGIWENYFHLHEPGAGGAQGPMLYVHPDVIMVRGGRLNLTAGGLVH